MRDCWFAVYFVGDAVGDAQVSALYEFRSPAKQFEWLVDIVFPDDALGVVLLEQVLTGLRQLDLHQDVASL